MGFFPSGGRICSGSARLRRRWIFCGSSQIVVVFGGDGRGTRRREGTAAGAAEAAGDDGGARGAGGEACLPAQRRRHRPQILRQSAPRLQHQEARRPPLPGFSCSCYGWNWCVPIKHTCRSFS